MYNVERKTQKFDSTDVEDLELYDDILSNPLCSILNSWREKCTDSEFNEGKLVRTETRMILVVTWEVKSLLL